MSIFLTLLGISLLIILHELGHYLAARACGMRVLRFSIGFGPKIWGRQIGETIWQVASIPLGGFVQIDGMGPSDPDGPGEDSRSFRNKPRWQRGIVLFAGPAMNWLLAVVFIALLAGTVGFKRYDQTTAQLGEIIEGGPANRAGLESGDIVLTIDEESVKDWHQLVEAVRSSEKETLAFEIQRGEELLSFSVTPRPSETGDHRMIDVGPKSETLRFGPLGAVAAGFRGAWSLTADQVGLLWGMLVGTKEGQLTGLPGIVKMVSAQAKRGLERLFGALAGLSITLAILNLVPIPALDGARLLFIGVEFVRRRPLDEKVEAVVHGVGFLLLLALMIVVSIRDLL